MQKKTVVLGTVALCAVIALTAWFFLRGQSSVQYRTAAVEHGDLSVAISATGSPNAVVTVQVGSQVSGTILALYANFNTKVAKGQLIARIDPAALQAKVDQGHANLQAAQAAVANAEAGIVRADASVQSAHASVSASAANVAKTRVATEDAKIKADRRTQLTKEGIFSREDADTAVATYATATADQDASSAQQRADQNNVKVAQADRKLAAAQLASNNAQVKQFEAALRSAQIDLDHTYIKAPVDGVVIARNVDVGQTVAASLATPTLFQIAQDLAKMQVDTNVSEADVGRVHAGQPATFTVDAYPGQIFKGAVTEVRKAPINVLNVITYDVVIGVSNPDLKLFPGMTANVKILVNQRTNVMKVPNSALRYRPASQTSVPAVSSSGARKSGQPEQAVWKLVEKKKPQQIKVTTGESDGVYTEVTSDTLNDGDRLIVGLLAQTTQVSGGSNSRRTPGL
jgi:HlyD family secretion protein